MADEFEIKVSVSPQVDNTFIDQIQKAVNNSKKGVTVTIDKFDASGAIQEVVNEIKSQLSNIKIGVTYTASDQSGSGGNSPKNITADLAAAQKSVKAFQSTYSSTMTKLGKQSFDISQTGTIKNYTVAWSNLSKAMKDANANATSGKDYISRVSKQANAFKASSKNVQQYTTALNQLSKAQETYNTAVSQNRGQTPEAKALGQQVDKTKDSLKALESAGTNTTQALYDGFAKDAQSASVLSTQYNKAAKNMTNDMSGVKQTMQNIHDLMSGNISDQNQIAKLSQFNNQLQNMQQIGVADTKAIQSMNKEISKIATSAAKDNGIKSMSDDLMTAERAAEALKKTYEPMIDSLGRAGLNDTNVGTIQNYEVAYRSLSQAMDEAAKTSQTGAQYIGKISDQASAFEQSTKNVKQYKSAMQQLGKARQTLSSAERQGLGGAEQVDDLRNSVTALQTSLGELDNAGVNATQDMYNGLADVTQQTATAQKNWQQMAKYITTDMTGVNQALQKANDLITNGVVTDPQQVASLTNYINQLQQMKNSGAANTKVLSDIAKGINKIEKQATPATSAIKGLVTQFKNMATSMVESMVIRQVFSTIQKGIRQIISTVKELDSAMTQLEIVTGASVAQLSQYFDAAADSAKAYGASITDIVGSMETFARLGYNLDESLSLTNAATVMSNVAATSVDEATTGITSIVKAFNIQADQVMDVADELVAVGQSYAISAEQLMEAFEKSGSSLAAANNSLEESIALYAAGNASVQNASSVGTALKTMSARIRSSTAELDEMGEEYDDLVASASKYREQIMALSGVDIMLDTDTYKSTYQIVKQIAQVWDQISDVSQAALLEDLAGKRNTNVLLSMINNLQDLEGAYQTASNAAGTATQANDIYMDSIEGRTAQLSATAEEFTEALNIQGLIKGVITSAQGLLDIITKFTNAISGLPGLIGAVGIAISALNLSKHIKEVEKATGAINKLSQGLSSMTTGQIAGAAISAAMLAVGAAISAYQSYQQHLEELRQGVAESAQTYEQASLDINSYADEVAELKGKLESTNISEEQAYEVRQRLLEIQNDLTDAYGDEAGNLDLVSGSADDAAESLREYTRALAESQIHNPDNIEAYGDALKFLSQEVYDAISIGYGDMIDINSLQNILSQYDTLSAYRTTEGVIQIRAQGVAQDIEADINALTDWLDKNQIDIGINSDIASDSEILQGDIANLLDQADAVISQWADTRDYYVEMQVAAKPQYSSVMDDITGIAEAIQDAMLSGDYSGLDFDIFNTKAIQDSIDNIDDEQVAKYLQKKLDEVMEDMGPVQLAFDVENSASSINELLNRINVQAGQDGKNGILNLQFGSETDIKLYNRLESAADSYGMSVQELLNELVQLGRVTDDSLEYSLMDLQDARDKVDQLAKSFQQIYSIDGGMMQMNYNPTELEQGYAVMQDYASQLYELQQYMIKSNAGKATARDFQNLTNTFPQLIGQTDNARFAVENLYNSIRSDSIQYLQDMLDDVDSDQARKELLDFEDQFLELCDVVQYTEFKVDIDAETDSLANLVTAINESNSATGVSEQSVANLTDRYKDLASFDPQALFERTSNGVKLNTQETQRLEAALKEQNHQLAESNLEYWQGEYYRVSTAIDNASSAAERADLYAQRDQILDQIEEVANLATRYEALTSSYNEYINATSTTNEHDMYDTIIAGYDDIEDMLARGWVTDEVRAYINMFTSQDLGTASVLEVADAWQHLGDTIEGTTYSALDFFTYDDNGNSTAQGVANFYDAIVQVQDGLGKMWAYTDENGQMVLDLGLNGQEELAEAFGVDIDLIEILIRSMAEAGDFDIHISNWTDEYTRLGKEIESCTSYVQELLDEGDYNLELNVNASELDDVQNQIDVVSQLFYDKFADAQGHINMDAQGVTQTLSVLEQLYLQQEYIEHPMILSLNTEEIDEEAQSVITTLQGVITTASEMEASISAGVDTSWAISEAQGLVEQIQDMDATVRTQLGLDDDSIGSLIETIQSTDPTLQVMPQATEEAINTLKEQVEAITPQMLVDIGVDKSLVEGFMEQSEQGEYDTESTVSYLVNDEAVEKWRNQNHDTTGKVTYSAAKNDTFDTKLSDWKSQTGTITYKAVYEGGSGGAYGTARAEGTAFAEGDWSAGSAGVALVGELGPEMVVTISQPRRLVTSGIINLFNCWDTLKVIKLQRRNEISPSANVTKVEKINHMRYGASLSLV